MDILTREDFQSLPHDAVVEIQYSSPFITAFEGRFSLEKVEGAKQLRPLEWEDLWDTYHDRGSKVTFSVVED